MSPVKSIQDPLNSTIVVEVEACQGGSGSRARDPLTGEIPHSRASQLKKKKKKKRRRGKRRHWGFHCYPNTFLISFVSLGIFPPQKSDQIGWIIAHLALLLVVYK